MLGPDKGRTGKHTYARFAYAILSTLPFDDMADSVDEGNLVSLPLRDYLDEDNENSEESDMRSTKRRRLNASKTNASDDRTNEESVLEEEDQQHDSFVKQFPWLGQPRLMSMLIYAMLIERCSERDRKR